MKLYVWENVLCDWTCGIIFATANSVEEAREIVLKEQDLPSIREAINDEPAIYLNPVAFINWGGG